MTIDGEAARHRDAEIPLAKIQFAPKPRLSQSRPATQLFEKGGLNFLYLIQASLKESAQRLYLIDHMIWNNKL